MKELVREMRISHLNIEYPVKVWDDGTVSVALELGEKTIHMSGTFVSVQQRVNQKIQQYVKANPAR
jgi:hypothetical protein